MLIDRHVQLVILHASVPKEMIANEIDSTGYENAPNLRVQHSGVSLVAELVHGLIGDDALEPAQTRWPMSVSEAALNELHSRRECTEPLGSQLMHRG